MANLTETELANHIPEITVNAASQGLGYLGKYLQMGRNVRKDFGEDFATKGDTLTIPKRGSVTSSDKTANSNVNKQAPSDSNVQVTLDTHKEVTLVIEDATKAKSIPGVTDGYAKDAALVLAEDVEEALAALYASAGNTIAYSSFSSWVQAIRRARRILVTNKVPKLEPVYAQIDEYAWETMLNENVIEESDKYGDDEPLKEAKIPRLSGVNLFESQIVGTDTSTSPDTHYNMVYHPEAMALAVRPLPDYGSELGVQQATVMDDRIDLAMRSTLSYDADALALQTTLDILFGVKVIRSEHMVTMSHQPSVDT